MDFAIENINEMSGIDGGLFGTVVFSHDEGWPEFEVTHHVMVKIRVKVSSDASIRDMREVLYRKAVEQLSRTLEAVDGKTAQQLTSEAEEKAAAERWKPG